MQFAVSFGVNAHNLICRIDTVSMWKTIHGILMVLSTIIVIQ